MRLWLLSAKAYQVSFIAVDAGGVVGVEVRLEWVLRGEAAAMRNGVDGGLALGRSRGRHGDYCREAVFGACVNELDYAVVKKRFTNWPTFHWEILRAPPSVMATDPRQLDAKIVGAVALDAVKKSLLL